MATRFGSLRKTFFLFPFPMLLAALGSARGQSLMSITAEDQMGEQPYQSYQGGDIDSIGLTNGTLSYEFAFSLVLTKGRASFEL